MSPRRGPDAIVCNSISRPYAGSDRATGDHGEGHCQGKVVVERLYFGLPDDGCQTEGRFEHGEVVAAGWTGSAAKRQVLPAIPVLGVGSAESVGVKHQRMVP